MEQTIYTIEQIAEKLQIHPMTVYGTIRRGKLKAYKLGKKSVRISQAHLDEYLQSCEVK